jgi:glycosyltransferase involved in cell wall biosynthesis
MSMAGEDSAAGAATTGSARTPARRARLAVIGLSYPFRGGISHFSTLLVRSLRERHEVSFITLRRQYPGFLFPGQTQFDFSDRALVEDNEQIIDTLNPLTWVAAARRLNREAPELIIVQWWHPFFAPAFGTIVHLLAPGLRNRVCFICHNVMPHEGNPLQGLLTRYAFPRRGFYIVHSEQDREQLQALRPRATVTKGFHPTYAEFGEGGIPTKEEARRTLGITADERTLLFFGLIRPYKGLKFLLQAMPLLRERLPCRLLVVGEFYDDKTQYMDLIRELQIEDCVTVVDRYVPNEEVATYFCSADVTVLPYISATGSGIVQIAFGLGVPVITTDVGGLPEAVDDASTGFVVAAGSAEALADAIVRYYEEECEARFRHEIEQQRDRFGWAEEIALIEEFVALAG